MGKKKTDDELQREISEHSENVRELLEKSRQIHKDALRIGLSDENLHEHILTMNRAIEFQRMAIAETKKVNRLQKILLNRQTRRMSNQRNDLLGR